MNCLLVSSRQAARRWLLVASIALSAATFAGEVYRWTDANGDVHFGDTPPHGAQVERLEIQPTPTLPGMVPRTDPSAGQVRPRPRDVAEGRAACDQARRALAALESGRPVYTDVNGAFRVKRAPGHPDAYGGPRLYLSDAERGAETARQQQALARACANFPELKDKRAAEEDLFRAENCENAQVRWNELSRPEAHADVARVENARKELAQWCDQGDAPAQR